MLVFAAIVGLFTILIFNIGYDTKSGCYYKPNNLEVHIKKTKE